MTARTALVAGLMALFAVIAFPASADVVSISPGKDVTLYENGDGSTANGAGSYFFTGRTNGGEIRRGMLWFDIASAIPAGSKITSATLRLRMSKTIVGPLVHTLHAVERDWGEGASNAFGQEGGGVNAEPGDATWVHTFFDDQFWQNPGGDFDPKVLSSVPVGTIGFYTWPSTPEFVTRVQSWLDEPKTNFGLLLLGDETVFPSAKRFDSRENASTSNRPVLEVMFEPALPPADLLSAQVTFGQLLGGTVDDLRLSDDAYLRVRSRFGFTALEPNFLQLQVLATTDATDAQQLAVTIESGINHPAGTATLRLRNWQTGQLQVVESFAISNTESAVTIDRVDATDRIRNSDGRIELSVRHVVIAVFTALGFDSRFDLVEVQPQ